MKHCLIFFLLIINFYFTTFGQSTKVFDLTPIWGHRYKIIGDFDGDGKKDTLTEHFVDNYSGKETNKYFDCKDTSIDGMIVYDSIVHFSFKRNVSKYFSSAFSKLDTLFVTGQFGVLYAKNIGDINDDGRDEIALVNDFADYSSLNSCFIYRFINGKWKAIYNFHIHEDWIPFYDWNDVLVKKDREDPVRKIGKRLIEVRICDGGDENILKVTIEE